MKKVSILCLSVLALWAAAPWLGMRSAAAGTFTVSNTNDSGPGSLRQAITDANASGGGTITATGVSGTIDLLAALPDLHSNLVINGPGSAILTVERSAAPDTPNFSVFTINNGSTVSISGLTIKNGKPLFNGGGIFNQGALTLSDCAITNNSAVGVGGGIFTQGTLVITNCTIADNSADSGAGINNFDFSVTITDSTISNNTAQVIGGGITSDGTLTISNSAIINNAAVRESGGGIFNYGGRLTIADSTIAGNSALWNGGGIFDDNDIHFDTMITNSTITNNSAGISGGGIDNEGTPKLQSSIVAKNSGPVPDMGRSYTSLGHNLIGDTRGGSGANASKGDLINVDPMLELDGTGKPLLKDNGGPTKTIALLNGSPAIDHGLNASPPLNFDQRSAGFARTVDDPTVNNGTGDGTDIGAFEVQAQVAIKGVVKSGKNLVISGTGFLEGAKILIDGEPRKTIYESSTSLIGKKAAKGLPFGAKIKVRNLNGMESNEWAYQ